MRPAAALAPPWMAGAAGMGEETCQGCIRLAQGRGGRRHGAIERWEIANQQMPVLLQRESERARLGVPTGVFWGDQKDMK